MTRRAPWLTLAVMTLWLVAEDRVQIVRADSVITFTAVPVKPTGIEHADPLARMPSYDRIRILAATASARNADASPWTALITFKANGKGAVKCGRSRNSPGGLIK